MLLRRTADIRSPIGTPGESIQFQTDNLDMFLEDEQFTS